VSKYLSKEGCKTELHEAVNYLAVISQNVT